MAKRECGLATSNTNGQEFGRESGDGKNHPLLCVLCHDMGKSFSMEIQFQQGDSMLLPGCPVSPPVAPYSYGPFARHFIGTAEGFRGTAINPWRLRGRNAAGLDLCQRAFFAAWLPPCPAAGIVVVLEWNGRQQSEPDRKDAPRHSASVTWGRRRKTRFLPEIHRAACLRRDSGPSGRRLTADSHG